VRHRAGVGPEAHAIARHVGGRVQRDHEGRFVAGADADEIHRGPPAGHERASLIEDEDHGVQPFHRLPRGRILHQARHRQAAADALVAQRQQLQRRGFGRGASAGRALRAGAGHFVDAEGDQADREHRGRRGKTALPSRAFRRAIRRPEESRRELELVRERLLHEIRLVARRALGLGRSRVGARGCAAFDHNRGVARGRRRRR
jgi:hypothetical protein